CSSDLPLYFLRVIQISDTLRGESRVLGVYPQSVPFDQHTKVETCAIESAGQERVYQGGKAYIRGFRGLPLAVVVFAPAENRLHAELGGLTRNHLRRIGVRHLCTGRKSLWRGKRRLL